MGLKEQFDALIAANDAEIENYKAIIAQQGKPKLPRVGINTHLFSAPIYKDLDKVIAALKQARIYYIRQDFDYNADTGLMKEHDNWTNNIKPKLDAAGIHVRAMFYIRGSIDNAYNTWRMLCTNYPYFDEIEIGNENAIRSLVSGKPGDKASDYDQVKLKSDCDYILQAYLGILSMQKPISIYISITWTHFYYNDVLKGMGVNAYLSLHSYTDAWRNKSGFTKWGGETHFEAVQNRYGKLLVEVGESNYMPKDEATYSDANQLAKFVPQVKDMFDAGIDFYIFSLIDEANRSGREKHFGLFNSDWSPKPILDELLKLW